MKIFFALGWLLHLIAGADLARDLRPETRAPLPVAADTSITRSGKEAVRNLGVVVFFDKKKGVGMIRPNSSNSNVIVYAHETEQAIKAERQVTYVVAKDKKRGERAIEVKIVKP